MSDTAHRGDIANSGTVPQPVFAEAPLPDAPRPAAAPETSASPASPVQSAPAQPGTAQSAAADSARRPGPQRPAARRRPSAAAAWIRSRLTWQQKVRDWHIELSPPSLVCSLLLHAAILLCLGIVIVHEQSKNDRLQLIASETDTRHAGLDLLDSRMDEDSADLQPESPPVQMASLPLEQRVDPKPLDELVPSGHGTDGAEAEGIEAPVMEVDFGNGIGYAVPQGGNVVGEGSYTAWTDPEYPAEGESYRIIIQIQLPKGTRRYRANDLSGMVVGDDGWRQRLPVDRFNPLTRGACRTPSPKGGYNTVSMASELPILNDKVQLIIDVPGAREKVTDVITLKSKLLKEERTLTLQFGRPGT